MIIKIPETHDELLQVYNMSKDYTNNHQTWREYLSKNRKYPDLFFGAYEEGKLIGEAFGYVKDDGACGLHSIAVHGKRWKRGIGRKLIRVFEKACKKYSSRLEVSTRGKPEGFYLKVGYKPRGLLAVYEHGRTLPNDLKIKPSNKSIRRRDNTRFAFFLISNLTTRERKRLQHKFKADEVCLVLEKKLK
jgi:GNAT superfamily N-acetyltransferase